MKNKQVNFELTNFKIYSKNKGEHTLNCERNLFNSIPSDKKKKSGQKVKGRSGSKKRQSSQSVIKKRSVNFRSPSPPLSLGTNKNDCLKQDQHQYLDIYFRTTSSKHEVSILKLYGSSSELKKKKQRKFSDKLSDNILKQKKTSNTKQKQGRIWKKSTVNFNTQQSRCRVDSVPSKGTSIKNNSGARGTPLLGSTPSIQYTTFFRESSNQKDKNNLCKTFRKQSYRKNTMDSTQSRAQTLKMASKNNVQRSLYYRPIQKQNGQLQQILDRTVLILEKYRQNFKSKEIESQRLMEENSKLRLLLSKYAQQSNLTFNQNKIVENQFQ